MTTEKNRIYKSKRLKGMSETWSDIEFLLYIRDRVDFRAKFPDLKEVSDKRISKIINKLAKFSETEYD